MQVPEPARLVSPSVRKRQFIEQKRAEEEARRRQQSQNASAESTKVTTQVCAASATLAKASLLCIKHCCQVHPGGMAICCVVLSASVAAALHRTECIIPT